MSLSITEQPLACTSSQPKSTTTDTLWNLAGPFIKYDHDILYVTCYDIPWPPFHHNPYSRGTAHILPDPHLLQVHNAVEAPPLAPWVHRVLWWPIVGQRSRSYSLDLTSTSVPDGLICWSHKFIQGSRSHVERIRKNRTSAAAWWDVPKTSTNNKERHNKGCN